MRYTIIWDPKQLSPDAINMMQNIVDSHLNLQLDNYYLINKGRSRMAVIPRYNEMTLGVFEQPCNSSVIKPLNIILKHNSLN